MTVRIIGSTPAPPEELWADARFGIQSFGTDASQPQGDALQAFIDTVQAKERLGRIPPCSVYNDRQLVKATNAPLRLVGAGKEASIITMSTDVGAGMQAIRTAKGDKFEFEHFQLRGTSVTVSTGSLPMQMSGLRLEGSCRVKDMKITSFGAAIELVNDHHYIAQCDVQGNGYGLLWAANPIGGLGDHTIVGLEMGNQKRASIGLASSAAIANARFSQNAHIGFAPYGIYRFDDWLAVSASSGSQLTMAALPFQNYQPITIWNGIGVKGTNIPAGTTITSVTGGPGAYTVNLSASVTGAVSQVVIGDRGVALAGVIFENHSFEYCNHNAMYDEPMTGSWEFTWDPPAESSTGGAPVNGPEWVGKPLGLAGVHVHDILRCHYREGEGLAIQQGRPAVAAHTIKDVTVDRFNNNASGISGSTVSNGTPVSRPFDIIGTPADGCVSGLVLGVGSTRCAGLVASEAINKGDLVERTPATYGKCRRSRNGVDSQILGFALNDFAVNDVCIYTFKQPPKANCVRNYTGSVIASGKLLTPDPANTGGVKAYTGAAGERLVGLTVTQLSAAQPAVGDAEVDFR